MSYYRIEPWPNMSDRFFFSSSKREAEKTYNNPTDNIVWWIGFDWGRWILLQLLYIKKVERLWPKRSGLLHIWTAPHIEIQTLIYRASEIDWPIKNVMEKYFPVYERNDNINNEKSFVLDLRSPTRKICLPLMPSYFITSCVWW